MDTASTCPDCAGVGYHYEAIDATPTMNLRESPKHTCSLCGGTGMDPVSLASRELLNEYRTREAAPDDARRQALADEIARRDIDV